MKRWHDLDKPGTYWWLCQIPIANIVFGCILFFTKGTSGPNKYGPDPLGAIGDQGEADLRSLALREVESDERESSTWAHALQESQGNPDQTKARYITLRVAQFSKDRYHQQVQDSVAEIDKEIDVIRSEIEAMRKKKGYNDRIDQKVNKINSLISKKRTFAKYNDDESRTSEQSPRHIS